ncbi:S8 family peptidase [Cellulomonas flavigena]|uniref:S8 family peptidase n=2 Tax=Actinomycetes TaxID=1760 RepID=UPI000AE98C3B|nr:S8/S53 family peptidase [Cellulomonas flavigena]
MVTTPPTRAARAARAAACAAALSVATAALPAGPAHAADTITAADQPYYAYYHLDQARAKGYTGQGVTIALLDGEVDTTAPELTGATITDKTPCTVTSSLRSKSHGTAMASILVSDGYGVAPGARLLTYQTGNYVDGDQPSSDCIGRNGARGTSAASLINHAINDGAQIISISSSNTEINDSVKWAIARANSQGILIVGSAGNEASDGTIDSYGKWSGVVGVSAIDTSGKRADYSSWGNGVTTAAVGGPVTARSYETGENISANGTSNSTPLVAGFLAIARQKWPDATANQLLQVLTHTGLSDQSGWNKYTGYGVANLSGLVNTDPSQYPDENPLADKGGGSSPTPEEIQQYEDGVVNPFQVVYDDSYVYRGLDESFLSNSDITYPMHIGTSPRYHGK